tara:strand:+ start:1147 stop:1362 length:216 start_codon:yes stop_codon:yes gene_type:complete
MSIIEKIITKCSCGYNIKDDEKERDIDLKQDNDIENIKNDINNLQTDIKIIKNDLIDIKMDIKIIINNKNI